MFKRYKTSIDLLTKETSQKSVQTEVRMSDMQAVFTGLKDQKDFQAGMATNTDTANIPKQTEEKPQEAEPVAINQTEEKELPQDMVLVRDRMKVYKSYLDKGECMPPGGGVDDFFSDVFENPSKTATVVELMIEYKLPEMYKMILDGTSYATWSLEYEMKINPLMALHHLHNFTDSSKALCERVIAVGLLQNCVDVMTDQNFMQNYITNEMINLTFRAYSGTLTNCVRHVAGHALYKELDLINAVQPYLSSPNMTVRVSSIMVLSALISEDENGKLEDTGFIPFMVEGVHKALSNSQRLYFTADGFFNICELLECLHRIAANDANKIKLVEAGLLPDLVKCMQTGSDEEQEIAAKLIWTLCFSDSVKEKVMIETDCVSELERLSQSDRPLVTRAANGALWKLRGEEKHQKQRQNSAKQTADKTKHIFISYQWANQQVILQINERLKRSGYRTWIDVEQMGGSTLDAMAAAVENASLVLVCASEKYKLSPNCRTEAEYTFQTKKPIVPLMLQRHYKPDGWLGMLMGAKLYVNFDGKYEFEEAYTILLREMNSILKADPAVDVTDGAAIVPQVAPVFQSAPPAMMTAAPLAAASWSRDQVMEWATKHSLLQLTPQFQTLLESMDGQQLTGLCDMKKQAPEFFYKVVREECELNIMAFLRLQQALAALH